MTKLVAGVLIIGFLVGCSSPLPTPVVPLGPRPAAPTTVPTPKPVKKNRPTYPKIGEMTPEFTLPDLQGLERHIDEFQGKVVMLNFWASWCGPCRLELPALVEAYETYRDRGFFIIAVNVRERRDQASRFATEWNMSFPILLDSRGAVSSRYRVRGIPMSVFLDREGTINDIHVGVINAEQIRTQVERLLQLAGSSP